MRQEVGYGCRFSTSHFPEQRSHSCLLGQNLPRSGEGISCWWRLVIGFSHHNVIGWLRGKRGGGLLLSSLSNSKDMHSFRAHNRRRMNNLRVINMHAFRNFSLDQGHEKHQWIEYLFKNCWLFLLWFWFFHSPFPPHLNPSLIVIWL